MTRETAKARRFFRKGRSSEAEHDAHRRDVRFAVGNEVLLDTQNTPLPSRSQLSSCWLGSFKILASLAPIAKTSA